MMRQPAATRPGCAGRASLFALAVILCASPSTAQHFRGGTLMWNRHPDKDRTVVFIFGGTFSKSYLGFRSGGLGRPPQVGDTVVISGTEPIRFKPGESPAEDGVAVRLHVTQLDEHEDWIKGVWTHEHTYPSATSPSGAPWPARIEGCCRYSALASQAQTPFRMLASVDLGFAIGSTLSKGSGQVPSVSILRTFAGPPAPEPTPPPVDSLTGDAAPFDWEPGYESRFIFSHPNLQSPLVVCDSSHGRSQCASLCMYLY